MRGRGCLNRSQSQRGTCGNVTEGKRECERKDFTGLWVNVTSGWRESDRRALVQAHEVGESVRIHLLCDLLPFKNLYGPRY